ncbi:acyl-CoA dehydrogenase [Ktedonobacter sp. SOSP1-52]|uniref:acyl-CoA dehydrogenase family protein n=1 Tax=Ktedonobacter sp. SOSP1-52 TaxID=2778366 RepID=UPI001915EE07|nr:acyl-CoA dehydrogenase family protein [Ktedonobacter sp. SOSP1-52]GHO69518.1 acyl-CoA dehydrogenase [Ktedonobacter sp. SOSP1-52]
MIFDLNEEQSDIRDMVRRFTQNEITPHAESWDEHNHFPREIFTKMAELGLMGMTTPEELGGSMLSRLAAALVYEELAQGDMATAVGLSVHNMVTGSIARFGDEEQRERWVGKLASGEALGAFSLSEAAAGSDAASLQCRAERSGDSYILNGNKLWVTNAGEADIYLLMARTAPGNDASGISCFVIEKDTPGFAFGKTERKMGLHSSPTRELIFENCQIPVSQRLGEEGQGFKIALSSLDGGRINIGAVAVGVAQAAFETARQYAQERQQFGKPIGTFQAIEFMLADMAMKVEASRLLVYEAAYKLDQSRQPSKQVSMYASMAKCFATDSAMEVTTNAVQVLGGAGYVRDYPVERYMRDVKVAQIFEGTNQIQRIVIGRALLDQIRA